MATTRVQEHFRFRNDDGSETTASWYAALDTNITPVIPATNSKLRLRINVRQTGTTAATHTQRLYKSKNGGAYAQIGGSDTDGLKIVDSTNYADEDATTQQISSGGAGFVAGKMDDVSGQTGATGSMAQNVDTEHEYMLEIDFANLADGDTFDLRARQTTSALNTYNVTARITVTKNAPPTTALNSPADTATGIDTLPQLQATGTDTNSDNITYEVQVNNAAFTNDIVGSNLTVGGDATTYVTASVSPAANALILVAVVVETNTSTNPGDPSLSGNSLTWVLVKSQIYDSSSTSRRKLFVFRGLGASPTSGAITITPNETSVGVLWSVDQFTNVNTSGSNGSGAIGNTASNSDETGLVSTLPATLADFSDTRNATYGAVAAATGTLTITQGSGFTKLNSTGLASPGFDIGTEWRNDNDTTVDMSLSANDFIGIIGIEIIVKAPILDKLSASDAGFVDITNGGDTDPFASGDKIGYTVQQANILSASTTYYWRVRGKDPTGSNTFGAWSTTRSFTTGASAVALSGTVTASITEADIVAGGKTIILTLTDDLWVVAAGSLFDNQRQNIIDGIDSAQSEAHGWDAEVKAKIAVTDVVRTSDTVVTITLDAEAAYNITAQETITATVPGTALVLGGSDVASPTFTVDTVGGGGTDYTKTFTDDILTISEPSFVKAITRSLSDSLTISETIVKAITRTLAETITLSETFVKAITRILSDDLTLSEVFSTIQGRFISLTDNLTISDTISYIQNRFLSFAETITISEVFARAYTRILSETITLTEVFSTIQNRFLSFVDSLTITDTISRAFTRVFSETLTLSEVFAASRLYLQEFAETITLSETFSKTFVLIRNFTDSITITDYMWWRHVKGLLSWLVNTATGGLFSKDTPTSGGFSEDSPTSGGFSKDTPDDGGFSR